MNRFFKASLLVISAACALVFAPAASAQVAGQNVNMVSGTSWPGGDPFLQRQNEPSMAVSTRNPMHILAGANDYRTVDLELALSGGEETGDSWLGLFKSFDGGLTWKSTLLPGCKYADPQCVDNGALHGGPGYDAGSDPVVRAGTNGMFYYAGLAFDRATSPTTASGTSTIFVARYNDLNNNENADPITYIDTNVVARGNNSEFLDKPALAVDIPRSGATSCSFGAVEPGVLDKDGKAIVVQQSFAAGNVYMTYTDFLAGTKANSTPTHLMFTRSTDCGVTWSAPVQLNTGTTTSQGSALAVNAINGNVYVTWRQFASTGIPDAIMAAQSKDAGRTFGAPVRISTFTPFDQGTTNTSIRTNAYPSITTDLFGFVYVAFSAKNMVASGDARVVVAGSIDGAHWTPAIMVDNPSKNSQSDPAGRGHQLMPAIAFANGRLTLLYYDLRLDHYENVYTSAPKTATGYTSVLAPEGEQVNPVSPSKVFTPFIDDLGLTMRRHTLDLRVLELGIFPTITLGPSVLVSQYAFGCCVNPNLPSIEQFKFNVPNLPIFGSGHLPFLGDYIDVVPSPAFVPNGNSWAYNFKPSVNPQFHATWTDNRDVVPPLSGDWTNYTPAVPINTLSKFTGAALPTCKVGQEGMRNQNIYTAQITGGLIAGAKGNSKPLGTTIFPVNSTTTVPLQRAFAVEAQNVTSQSLNVRFTIANQPTGGKASFLQFSQLLTLDITIPPFSSVSRSVFVTSTNAQASVTVNVVQIGSIGGSPTNNGLSSSAILNPDVTNPNITNPNVTNPNITNPNITNYEVTNPNVTNPNITNPNVTNPNITNPNITNPNVTNPNITNPNVTNVSATNPNVTNPNITNPNITNPNITNPNITNPNVTNGSIQDVIYPITNTGNTTATYTVKVATSLTPPNGVLLQLILNKLYQTPTAIECQLTTETHWETVANIIAPKLYAANDPQLANPNITNSTPNEASVTLGPGETAYIDFRVFSPTKTPINPLLYFTPVTIPQAVNTTTALANPGGILPTPSVPALIVTTPSLPDSIPGQAYSATVAATGGNPGSTYTFSVDPASLPAGLSLTSATGVIAGTPTTTGTFVFSIQVKDTATGALPQHTTAQTFTIHVAAPLNLNPAPLQGTTPLTGGTHGTAYNQTISPVGGLAPVTISLLSGSLPAGLTFSNGAITGIPTGTGTSSFTVRATDSSSPHQVLTVPYSINIVAAGPTPNAVSFVNQPQASIEGQPLSGNPIKVLVTDANNLPVMGANVAISFNGAPACASATLSAPPLGTVHTDATGTAQFTNLSVDRGQVGFHVTATVEGTAISSVSNAFNVSGYCDTNDLKTARRNHLVIALPNGKILIAGGTANADLSGALPSAELYDPATHTFTTIGPMNAARYDQTLTLLPNGKVLVAGGFSTNAAVLSSAELFDPAINTFSLLPAPMTSPRTDHTATLLANGKVLIAGGTTDGTNALASAEIFDPATNTFTASAHTMNSVRHVHHADLLPNGLVLISGGYNSSNAAQATAEIYDPVADTFTPTGSMTTSRGNHASALLYTGKVLVAGGTTGSTPVRTATAELYDPSTGTFTPTANMSVARGHYAGIVLNDGAVFISGGAPLPAGINADIYDPGTQTFSTTGNFTMVQTGAREAVAPDGTVLLASGVNGAATPATVPNSELYYPITLPPGIVITTTSLPNAQQNEPYTQVLLQHGGVAQLTWSSLSLPAGLALSPRGILTGAPTQVGTFDVPLTVTDGLGQSKSVTLTLQTGGPLLITTTTLPNARTDSGSPVLTYSPQIATTGGAGGAITFSVVSGALPPTITLNSATGMLSSSAVTNVPTATYNFTIQAVSAGPPSSTATQPLSITVVPFFTTTNNNNLPSGTVGTPYSQTFNSTGGVPPYSYQLLSFGTGLPPGMTFSIPPGNPSAAQVSGTPTTSGNYNFLLSAGDSTSPAQSYTEEFFITIGATPPGPVASMTFTTQPTNSIAGQIVGSPFPAVTALDAGNNPVPNATITMSIANNPCTTQTENLVLSTTATTNASGVATFAALRLTPAGKPGFTLLATAPSAVTATSASFLNVGSCNTANLPHATRSGATTTVLADGTILIAGGEDSTGIVATAEIYNPATGTFTLTTDFNPATGVGNMNIPRAQHTATLLSNGQVLIVGGNTAVGPPTTVTNRLEIYDPGSHSFTLVSPEMDSLRSNHTATLLPGGSDAVLIAGGFNGSGSVGTAQIYINQTLSPSINMISARNQAQATLLSSGDVLITGGFTPANPTGAGDNTAEIFHAADPAAPSFHTFTPTAGTMASGHVSHTSTLLNSGLVLIAGGENGSSNCLQTAETYSTTTNTFTATGSMINGRCSHSATVLSNGKVLMAGGWIIFGNGGWTVNEVYDPGTTAFISDAAIQRQRVQMGAVRLTDGTVFLVGGTLPFSTAIQPAEIYYPAP